MLKKVMIVLAIITLLGASAVGYGLYRLFNRFGPLVDEELSDSYFYNRAEDGVIYSPMGNWFELGQTPMEVDVESFEVLSNSYAKDKNYGYCKEERITVPIDVPSFTVKWNYVPMDKNQVYWPNSYSAGGRGDHNLVVIPKADPKSYTLIDPEDLDFAIDNTYVFYRERVLEGMDPRSFEVLTDYFCKDAHQVLFYRYNQPVEVVTAVASEIVVLDHGYIRDGQHLYKAIYNDTKDRLEQLSVAYQDTTTLRFFDEWYMGVDGRVYYDMKLIENADAESFQLINVAYTKDKDHIFYKGIRVDADVHTFEIPETYRHYQYEYARDANTMFYKAHKIPKADPNSFEFLRYDYAKDAKHIFYKGMLLEDADRETFTFDSKKFQYKDKDQYYSEGKPE